MQMTFAQQDFREETIYFLMTTRFFDGDPNNTRPTEWSSYGANSPSITDPNDVTWRGDFKGLIEKLDYIKDLGFTAIWITPVVQNRGPLDYHGYHAWDFTKVDPRLESPGATFQDLINAVHAKGMKIILDIVTNHAGRFGIKGRAEIKYNTDPNAAWYAPDNPNWTYDGLTPNPCDGKIWSRANLAKMPPPYNNNLAAYNWPSTEAYVNTSDPAWYHHSGNGFAQGYDDTTNLYQRALAGDTPDLNTESSVVRDYMFNAYKTFIDMGVDGFRWDTWKHMSKEDIFHLLDRFRAVKPDLFVVGEVAQKRHELHQVQEINPHWYTWRGNVGSSASANVSVLDFYAESTFHGVFQDGGGFSGVQAAARYDHLYSDPSQLVTWLDNHDFGPNNDWNQRYSGSDENLAACMNFMFTWRGIPCVYYGTENRFKAGAYTDIHNEAGIRQSIDNTGRAYFGSQFATAPNHRIYKHIRKLNAIRRAIPALQKGSWAWAGNAPGNGVGYWREFGASKVAVGLAKDGSASFTFNNVPNGTYRDAVTGRSITVSNGTLSFTVQSTSAGIYVLNGTGMIGESGAGFFEPCVSNCSNPLVINILPTSSNYTSPTTVSLSAEGGKGHLTIHYTTDGSTPSVSSPIYTRPFSVSSNRTVKAIAFDSENNASPIAAQVYTFEQPERSNQQIATCNIPPSVSATPGAGNYPSYPINISLTASNFNTPVQLYYTTDGSTPTASSTAYTGAISLGADGVAKTLKVYALDNAGLSSVTTFDYTFEPAPDIWIYFKRPSNWATTVKVHYWDAVPNGVYTPTTWPGVNMTPVCGDWYRFKFSGITSIKMVFNDGAGRQTGDLSRTATGYYDNAWLTSTPVLTGAPTVSVTPSGPQTSGQPIAVTVTGSACTGNATLYYTTDGSTPTTASPSATHTVNFNFTQTTTLKVYAIDGSGMSSAIQTHTFTITQLRDISIYFKKPTNWGTNIKIHYWNVSPNTHYPNTTWTGASMTDDGGGWYKFTFNQILNTNFVINNNGQPQTGDLYREASGWYDYTVTPPVWYNSDPRLIPVELVDFKGIYAPTENRVDLSWHTATEINNAYFDIERSLDASVFEPIGRQKGAGTTTTPQYYRHFDQSPIAGRVNYYRLKQWDTDGKSVYSKTIGLLIPTILRGRLKSYPNPARTILTIENPDGQPIEIINALGQKIELTPIGMTADFIQTYPIGHLPNGIYFVKTGNEVLRFIKS
jgi:glycosidase